MPSKYYETHILRQVANIKKRLRRIAQEKLGKNSRVRSPDLTALKRRVKKMLATRPGLKFLTRNKLANFAPPKARRGRRSKRWDDVASARLSINWPRGRPEKWVYDVQVVKQPLKETTAVNNPKSPLPKRIK